MSHPHHLPPPSSPQTYYGSDGIDFESVTDPCQQAAMKAMVKTYGQMPLQLFREPHPPRDKASVLTLSAIKNRILEPLKRFAGPSMPPIRATSQHFWMNIDIHKTRPTHSMSECDFLGEPFGPDLNHTYLVPLDTTPERIVYMGSGEVVVTKLKACFFPSSSPSYASILVTWGLWDNSLLAYSAAHEHSTLRLHPHLMDTVSDSAARPFHILVYLCIFSPPTAIPPCVFPVYPCVSLYIPTYLSILLPIPLL